MLSGCGGGGSGDVQSAYDPVEIPSSPPLPATGSTPLPTPAPTPAPADMIQEDSAWQPMTEIALNFSQQNAQRSWSFMTQNSIDRYEVRSGDVWSRDGADRERSESASRFLMEAGKTYQLEFSVKIEPGALNQAQWLGIMQIQSTFDDGEAGHSPPLGLELVGERFQVTSRYSMAQITGPTDMRTNIQYTASNNAERDRWYKFQFVVRFDPFGNGHLVAIQDGQTLLDYRGPIGFNDLLGPYVKMGVYRAATPETMAVQFTDIHFGVRPN